MKKQKCFNIGQLIISDKANLQYAIRFDDDNRVVFVKNFNLI